MNYSGEKEKQMLEPGQLRQQQHRVHDLAVSNIAFITARISSQSTEALSQDHVGCHGPINVVRLRTFGIVQSGVHGEREGICFAFSSSPPPPLTAMIKGSRRKLPLPWWTINQDWNTHLSADTSFDRSDCDGCELVR